MGAFCEKLPEASTVSDGPSDSQLLLLAINSGDSASLMAYLARGKSCCTTANVMGERTENM